MNSLRGMARLFNIFVERFYPDPFVFAIALTVIVVALALGLTEATPLLVLTSWGEGLKSLLGFMGQLSITLIAAHALAHTDLVRSGFARLGRLPRSAFAAYALTSFTASVASLFAWSFGLIGGALLAREIAVQARSRGLKVHYPLLCASAYSGLVVWHMGYSGTAPLFVATPGHALESLMGGTIPVTETIFSSWNIIIALITVATVPLVCGLMESAQADIVEISRDVDVGTTEGAPSDGSDLPLALDPASARDGRSFAQRMDNTRFFTAVIGSLLILYLIYWFWTKGLSLTLDIVNWTFLSAGLLLARSASHYVRLVANASGTVGQVILQYPFYAGIMGIMLSTGLASVIAQGFISVATASTLPFWAFLSGGFINMFIPSGGAQWVVQGPVFIEAAKILGTNQTHVVMGIAYGDQWTNMIQPFWTIPLLAIAGIHMRHMMGYCFVVLVVTFFIFGAGLLVIGAG